MSEATLDAQSAKHAFIVAISGPSSAGKSTLASLLAAIFQSSSENKATVIHQDSYFYNDKSQYPLCTFGSSKADEPFIESSLELDSPHSCLYTISWRVGGRTRTVYPKIDPGQREPPYEEMEKMANKAWEVELNEGEKDLLLLTNKYRITGPNSERNESVDFGAFLEAVNIALAGGVPTTTGLSQSHVNIGALVEKHSELIARMVEKIAAWTKAQAVLNAEARFQGHLISSPIENASKDKEPKASIRPTLCFVEGFLLFSNDPGNNETLSKKAELMPLFDMKLFLPAAKETAKKRRFSRPVYTDHPKGLRLPGQMWKSEGYFDQIVWDRFEEEHAWLLTDGGAKKQGIHVMEEMEADTEDTVEWAVDTILAEMERECAEKRAEGGWKAGGKNLVVLE